MSSHQGIKISAVVALLAMALAPVSVRGGSLDSIAASGEFFDHQTGAHNIFFISATELQTGSGDVEFRTGPFVACPPGCDPNTIPFPLGILRIWTQEAGPEEAVGQDEARNQVHPFEQSGVARQSFVRINNCTAQITAMVGSFSRYPYSPYFGPTTMDLRFEKKRPVTNQEATLDIKLYLPEHAVNIHADVRLGSGGPFFVMPSCTN
jgi:hypothetical protein